MKQKSDEVVLFSMLPVCAIMSPAQFCRSPPSLPHSCIMHVDVWCAEHVLLCANLHIMHLQRRSCAHNTIRRVSG